MSSRRMDLHGEPSFCRLLRRLYTLVFELPGRVREERFSEAEWFLIRSRPFAQRRPCAGRWAGTCRGLPPHDQVTMPRLSSGKAYDPASSDDSVEIDSVDVYQIHDTSRRRANRAGTSTAARRRTR